MALKLDGSLWSWGDNNNGLLRDGTFVSKFVPGRIAANATWKAVSAGGSHALGLREDGTLWSWGRNNEGQMGIGSIPTNPPYAFNTPQPVATNANWQSVAAGSEHTAALQTDGSLWTWGAGWRGQLGNGVFMTNAPYGIASPFAVEPAATWSAVAAGIDRSYGRLALGWKSLDLRR